MTDSPRPWVCCARMNDHDKAYFDRQLVGFEQGPYHTLTWQDDRAHPVHRSLTPGTNWERHPRFRGGRRLYNALLRARGRHAYHPSRSEHEALLRLAEAHPPNVLYAHTGFVALRLARLREEIDVPMVAHFHGLDVTINDQAYHAAMADLLPRLAQIFVVGDWMHARLVAMGAPKNIIATIPMGAPVIGCDIVVPIENHGTRFRFSIVSRLVGCKGIDRALAAFSQLPQRDKAEIVIVGDGPLRVDLEQQVAKLGLNEHVQFHGTLSAADALSEIAASDVLLHHALDEPGGPEAFGVAITEAMALGKPVVGTFCGGLPDQIVDQKTGFLVAQNDIAAMSSAMSRLICDPEMVAAFGEAGKAVAQRFDAAKLGKKVESHLLEIAIGKSASATKG